MPSFAENPLELSRDSFIARFGGVYEHSPWVAEAVFDQGLDQGLAPDAAAVPGLAARMAAVVDTASSILQKLTLLRAHPELAGKLALAGALTADSQSEQASAGLDACTPEEFEAFQCFQLNADYYTRFSFPFIIAVRGLHRTEILNSVARAGRR